MFLGICGTIGTIVFCGTIGTIGTIGTTFTDARVGIGLKGGIRKFDKNIIN